MGLLHCDSEHKHTSAKEVTQQGLFHGEVMLYEIQVRHVGLVVKQSLLEIKQR